MYAKPFELVSSQPVFAVTTPYGSPYLIFEPVQDDEDDEDEARKKKKLRKDEEDTREEFRTRQVALYFMDEREAMNLRDEMRQMDVMKGADMRIMATTLGKALRQASNLDGGLTTGQPIEDLTGELPTGEGGGGVLRYKIVPAKKELFYAARCRGRERVGLFTSENGMRPEDIARAFTGPRQMVTQNIIKRAKDTMREAQEDIRKNAQMKGGLTDQDKIKLEYEHMAGSLGIPVFYCPRLQKQQNNLKRFLFPAIRRSAPETPLFFSYEDLQEAWTEITTKMTASASTKAAKKAMNKLPKVPPNVEVYNLIDVVTSMDRDRWFLQRAAHLRRLQMLAKVPLVRRFVPLTDLPAEDVPKIKNLLSGLETVRFIPSTNTVTFKDHVTARGNGKARMRPMKSWGFDTL